MKDNNKTRLDRALEEVIEGKLFTVHTPKNLKKERIYTAKDADDLIKQCIS